MTGITVRVGNPPSVEEGKPGHCAGFSVSVIEWVELPILPLGECPFTNPDSGPYE